MTLAELQKKYGDVALIFEEYVDGICYFGGSTGVIRDEIPGGFWIEQIDVWVVLPIEHTPDFRAGSPVFLRDITPTWVNISGEDKTLFDGHPFKEGVDGIV